MNIRKRKPTDVRASGRTMHATIRHVGVYLLSSGVHFDSIVGIGAL